MTDRERFAAGNRRFVETDSHTGVGPAPTHGTVIVTCVDHRVDPAHTMGLGLGEALVIRTVGGRVTDPLLDEIAILRHLFEGTRDDGSGLTHVMVVHHTGCGAGRLGEEALVEALLADGVRPAAITERAIGDAEAALRTDVAKLASSSLTGDLEVSGHLYDIDTGLIEQVVAPGTVDRDP